MRRLRGIGAVLVTAFLLGSAGGSSPSALTMPSDVIAWIESRDGVRTATGVAEALEAGDFAGSAWVAAGKPALPELPFTAATVPIPPGLERFPLPARQAIAHLTATVVHVSEMTTRDPSLASAGAIVILRSIHEALPVLQDYASTLSSTPGSWPVDPMPLEHAAEAIQAARAEGRPFEADPEALRAYEAWLLAQNPPPPIEELAAQFHAGVTDRMPHALKHALHEIEMFREQLGSLPGASASGSGGLFDVGASATCTDVIPGVLRICDTDPDVVTTPVLLHIDLGGSDSYLPPYAAGGASGAGAVQVVIDLEGSDFYLSDDLGQGAGVNGGIGILVDVLGSDLRVVDGSSPAWGQGYGRTGAGVLVDLEGSDFYSLIDVHTTSLDPTPLFQSAFSPSVEVRGQGAADDSGLGLLLDAGGSDFYSAMAVTLAEVFFGPGAMRPDNTSVIHIARSSSATAQVQGAAEGQSVGVHADVSTVSSSGFGDGFFVFASSSASANEFSNIVSGGSRTCIAESGDVLVRAHGAAKGAALAIGARSGGGAGEHGASGFGFANAFNTVFAECFEVVFTEFNAHMQSSAHSGDAAVEAQGSGVDGGVGVLLQVSTTPCVPTPAAPCFPGFSSASMFADTVSTACSNCFQNAGSCNAYSLTGKASAVGQGSGQGGEGILLSLNSFDSYSAAAFESGSSWTLAVTGGNAEAVTDFDESPGFFGPPLPTGRVQGSAAGGVGALADVGWSDSYVTGFPGFSFIERFVTEMDPAATTFLLVPGLDYDKAEVDGDAGVAILADIGLTPDFYSEFGTPASGALDGAPLQTWGTLTLPPGVLGTEVLEIGIDA